MNAETQATDAIVNAAAHMGAKGAETAFDLGLRLTEFTAKLAGKGMVALALLLVAKLSESGKTLGRTNIKNMLRDDPNVTAFKLRPDRLKEFNDKATQYGILYTIVKDKAHPDAPLDIVVHLAKAPIINHILEDMGLNRLDQEQDLADTPDIAPVMPETPNMADIPDMTVASAPFLLEEPEYIDVRALIAEHLQPLALPPASLPEIGKER